MRYTETGALSEAEVARWNAEHLGDGDLLRHEPPSGTAAHWAWSGLGRVVLGFQACQQMDLAGRERSRAVLKEWRAGRSAAV